jgi:hypothetical protein
VRESLPSGITLGPSSAHRPNSCSKNASGGELRHQARGIGFDSAAGGLDVVAAVRNWEKSKDQLIWRLIVSPVGRPAPGSDSSRT